MKRSMILFSIFAAITLSANLALTQSRTAAEFERIKSLAGEWQGQGPEGLTNMSYQVAAGGSVVIETLMPPEEPSMVTLYHLDGEELMLTHYCSIGNQPRMRANLSSDKSKDLSFSFVDITNLANASQGHMRYLSLTFHDHNRITQVWTWREDGEDILATFTMERKN